MQKLLQLIGDQKYLKEDVTRELDEARDQLQYIIEKNKESDLYTQSVNRHFYVCPQGFKVSGLSF